MFIGHQEYLIDIDFVSYVDTFQLVRNEHIALCGNALHKFRVKHSCACALAICPAIMSIDDQKYNSFALCMFSGMFNPNAADCTQYHIPPQLYIAFQLIAPRQTIFRDQRRSRACVSQIPWGVMIFFKKWCMGAKHVVKKFEAYWMCCCRRTISCLRIQKRSTHQSATSRWELWTNMQICKYSNKKYARMHR